MILIGHRSRLFERGSTRFLHWRGSSVNVHKCLHVKWEDSRCTLNGWKSGNLSRQRGADCSTSPLDRPGWIGGFPRHVEELDLRRRWNICSRLVYGLEVRSQERKRHYFDCKHDSIEGQRRQERCRGGRIRVVQVGPRANSQYRPSL